MELHNFVFLLQAFFIFAAIIFSVVCILFFAISGLRKARFSQPAAYSKNNGRAVLENGLSTAAKIDEVLLAQLRRVNVSFYFSLILATVGLLMVMFALLGIEADAWHNNLFRLVGALLIELVSIAFFLNSLKAQREIGDVMKAERDERMNGEISDLLAQISDPNRRDQLIAQLIMKRSAVGAPRLS